MKITKREIIASISIIAIMLLIGVLISGKINEYELDANEKYTKAVHIEDQDLFEHGMATNVGNAFVYGDLVALDPVTYPEIGGEYSHIRKIKERYTKHTKYVTVNGKRKMKTYWTWDEIDRDEVTSTKCSFLNHEFEYGKIVFPSTNYIDTIMESTRIRYVYYGAGTRFVGTIFAELRDDTIPDGTDFYSNRTIEEVLEYFTYGELVILFWLIWIILIGILIYVFYINENKWLEGD